MTDHTGQNKKGKLYVVSGPSGSGKSTLCRAVAAATDAALSISATTRPRSEQEIDGKDYYFLSEEAFREKVRRGEFLEYARVFDHYYGTPVAPVRQQLEQGRAVILEIDVQGAAQVFAQMPGAVGILIMPPSDEELRRRLRRRGRDDPGTVEKRLAQAHREIETARRSGHYKHTIVNDDLARAVREMTRLITQDGIKQQAPPGCGA